MKKLFISFLYCIAFFQSAQAFNSQTLPILTPSGRFDDEKEKSPAKVAMTQDGFMDIDQGSLRSSMDEELDIPETDAISVYVVRPGDTIASIAALFDVSPNTVIWANDLRKKSVAPGDTLVILPVNGIRHVVKQGDTLKKIATLYKADVSDIELFNGITENTKLDLGDTIIVPQGEIIEPKKEVKKVVTKKKPTAAVTNNSGAKAGYYARPMNGIKTQGVHGRNGVDIAAPIGTSVRASAEGTVIISKTGAWNGGYGNYIVIQHQNGTQTLYAHLSVLYAQVGQSVEQGATLAGSGNSGRSTGPHLHFEIRNGPRNPF